MSLKKLGFRGVFIVAVVVLLAIGVAFALQDDEGGTGVGDPGGVARDTPGVGDADGIDTALNGIDTALNGMDSAPAAKAAGTMTLGDDDAPITVIEYSDFQCPFCSIFARDIQPELIEKYVDTGQVRFEWRNFPIFGRFSQEAALGSYCADDQDAFWPYHDALYEAVGSFSESQKNVDSLVNIAESLDLDAAEFRTCIEERRHLQRVQADYDEARSLGLTGTPSFMANGMLIIGAQPLETWEQVVEMLSE